MTTLRMPVLDENGTHRGYENVPGEQVEPGIYRVLLSPGIAEGYATQDLVEADDETKIVGRVIQRSGNLVIWLFLPDGVVVRDQALIDRVNDLFRDIAGSVEGGGNRNLILCVPLQGNWPQIEAVAGRAADALGSTWVFGNVYEPVSGEPLRWWEHA